MARPPSRSKPPDMQGLTQLPPSPRMGMLRPLTPSSSSGLAVTGEGRDSVGEVKREVRAAAAKLAELAGAVETDGRMKDSSSLLRRPFTPGGSALPPRPGTGKASMLGTASDIDALIGTASEAKNPKAALTELLFQVVEDTERCVLTLTEKRAPRPAHLPEPSASAGRVGSRMQVHDALIDRALALHGALQSSSSHASGSSSPVVPASVPDATKAVENPKELAALREELRAAKEECERLRNRPSPAAAPPPAPPAAAPPAPAAAPAPAGDSKRVEELVAQKRELEEQKRALTLDRTHLTEEQGRFKEEVARLEADLDRLKTQLDEANNTSGAALPPPSRPGTATTRGGDVDPAGARMEVLSLRGDLGVLRTQLEKARTDVISAEVRYRSEREKLDDLQKVVVGKDETISSLRSDLRRNDRLNQTVGDPDSFEAVLAEEMETMRESFEQKLASLNQQLERESVGYAKERKEMREEFEKETKRLKRRIDTLQMRYNDFPGAEGLL